MSVQELSLLHRRYIELSDRFKAAWTFHQFLQGLNRIFSEGPSAGEQVSFQAVYASLKGISKNLTASATEQLRGQLDKVEGSLAGKVEALLLEDTKVSPATVRQFFSRVTNYDDKILVQLLKFYVYNRGDEPWSTDRLDKIDFLMTRLGEELQELDLPPIERDRGSTKEILHGLWAILALGIVDDGEVDGYNSEIVAIGEEMRAVDSLDALNTADVVGRYRDIKHRAGLLYFVPELALTILGTNQLFKQAIERLYRIEERNLHVELNEVFALERDTPPDLGLEAELAEFHELMERFERRLEDGNLRLADVARLRDCVRSLRPRLKGEALLSVDIDAGSDTGTGGEDVDSDASVEAEVEELLSGLLEPSPPPPLPSSSAAEHFPDAPDAPPVDTAEQAPQLPPTPRPKGALQLHTTYADLIGGQLGHLLEVLESSDWQVSPKAVTATPEAQPLRLQPREVVAFRRLLAGEPCDRELEQFLLESAAIRIRITREAEEIVGLVGEGSNGDEEVFRLARQTNRLADSFVHRYAHFIHVALQDGRADDALMFEHLRMRLLRDYSGLFLLTNHPD